MPIEKIAKEMEEQDNKWKKLPSIGTWLMDFPDEITETPPIQFEKGKQLELKLNRKPINKQSEWIEIRKGDKKWWTENKKFEGYEGIKEENDRLNETIELLDLVRPVDYQTGKSKVTIAKPIKQPQRKKINYKVRAREK